MPGGVCLVILSAAKDLLCETGEADPSLRSG
jgi:hypothetical protein